MEKVSREVIREERKKGAKERKWADVRIKKGTRWKMGISKRMKGEDRTEESKTENRAKKIKCEGMRGEDSKKEEMERKTKKVGTDTSGQKKRTEKEQGGNRE